MNRPCFLSLIVLGLLVVACAPDRDPDDPGDCSADLSSTAVRILVVDAAESPLRPSSVTYAVDGGSELDALCTDEGCTEWVTGYDDIAGQYSVTVDLNEPFPNDPWCFYVATETVLVEVTPGLCVLDTEELVVALQVEVICADGDGEDEPPEDDGSDGED